MREKKTSGLAIAALICGIVSNLPFLNPLYLPSLAAVILGIVGLTRPSGKVMAIVGLILGAIALIGGLVWDIIMLPITFGVGFFF